MPAKSAHLQIRVTPRQKAAIKRLARAAGRDVSAYVLSRVLRENQARFAGLLEALGHDQDRRHLLAELNDFLTSLAPAELAETVAPAELALLSPLVSNYVAAMVEQAAALKAAAPPAWVRDVPALDQPHFATPLPGLRLHLLRASPVTFKRRNLFVDAGLGRRV
ncbi:MAG: plasmid mobilization protein [Acidobacteriota bacterium]